MSEYGKLFGLNPLWTPGSKKLGLRDPTIDNRLGETKEISFKAINENITYMQF